MKTKTTEQLERIDRAAAIGTAQLTRTKIRVHNENVEPLTAEDIKYIRQAETIIPEFYWDSGEPTGQIRGMKDTPTRERYETITLFEIPAKIEFDIYYDHTGINSDQGTPNAANTYLSHQHHTHNNAYRELGAIAQILRKGDTLKIEWQFSAGNQYTQNAGLNVFRISIIIERGKKNLAFIVDAVTMPNNTASPVRFY